VRVDFLQRREPLVRFRNTIKVTHEKPVLAATLLLVMVQEKAEARES
jgi:hypothetical protein